MCSFVHFSMNIVVVAAADAVVVIIIIVVVVIIMSKTMTTENSSATHWISRYEHRFVCLQPFRLQKSVFFVRIKSWKKLTLECGRFRHQLLLTNFAYTYAEYRNRWYSNDIRRTSCTITEGKNWFFFSIHYNNISMFYMENSKDRAVLNDRKTAIKWRERKKIRMGLFISFIDIMFSEPSLMINYASSQPNERTNELIVTYYDHPLLFWILSLSHHFVVDNVCYVTEPA